MESPYYEMTHDFEEENRSFQSGYVKGYHDAVLKCPDIVRCKDCKHYRYYGLYEEIVSECIIDHAEKPDGDWFCADGERK